MKKTSKPTKTVTKKPTTQKPAAKKSSSKPKRKAAGQGDDLTQVLDRLAHSAETIALAADRLVASAEKLVFAADTLPQATQPNQQPFPVATPEALADLTAPGESVADLTAPAIDLPVDDATEEE